MQHLQIDNDPLLLGLLAKIKCRLIMILCLRFLLKQFLYIELYLEQKRDYVCLELLRGVS